MQGVKQELKRGEALLPVDNGPLLQRPRLFVNLLQYDGPEEVRLRPVVESLQEPFRHAHDIAPEWFPLVLFVPNVGSLEQRNHEPLRLHEHHLGSANLGLHRTTLLPPSTSQAVSPRSRLLFVAQGPRGDGCGENFAWVARPLHSSPPDHDSLPASADRSSANSNSSAGSAFLWSKALTAVIRMLHA
jgi:hypothetical protein